MSNTNDRSFREKATRWFKIAVAVYVIATLGWKAMTNSNQKEINTPIPDDWPMPELSGGS